MSSQRGNVGYALDARLIQCIGGSFGTCGTAFTAAITHKYKLYFGFVSNFSRSYHAAAEKADMRECVQMRKSYSFGTHGTHGQT